MNLRQITLVRDSFAALAPAADRFAANFYQRLFRAYPEVRPLFPADMAAQRTKLMDTLGEIVADLDKSDAVAARLGQLGRRHRDYGALDAHYPAVGEALLDTLRDALGPRATPDTMEAWGAAYDVLATTMLAAARD